MFSNFYRNPYLYILLSYIAVIFMGAILLLLPIATYSGINVVDAVYMATSAVCVTGLAVKDIGTEFTLFGQLVTLFLIQIGGIGVTVFSSFLFLTMRKHFSFLNQSVVEESMTMDRQIKIRKLVLYVVIITLSVELIGACFLSLFFYDYYPLNEAIYQGVFTSISAFCNAGFSLISNSLENYTLHTGINLTLISLIFVGGIGYFCIIETIRNYQSSGLNLKKYHFSIHTKSALYTSLLLIIIGAFLFFILEHEKLISEYGLKGSVLASFFQSITARTAGFSTVSFSKIGVASLMLFTGLMFIGASPASCGGGIKTTTFHVLIKYFTASFKNRDFVFMFHRSVPKKVVKKSMMLLIVASSWTFMAVLFVTYFERLALFNGAVKFEQLIFEVVSALGTVGLSTGISAQITEPSKAVIIATMYFGRTGLLTLVSFIAFSMKEERFRYPDEDIFVG